MNPRDFWMLGSGVVVTLILTGTVKWLFRLFDPIVPVSQAPDKLRTVFSVKTNRSLLWTSLLTLCTAGLTIQWGLDKSPITRLTIVYGILLYTLLFWLGILFVWEFHGWRRERRNRSGHEGLTAS